MSCDLSRLPKVLALIGREVTPFIKLRLATVLLLVVASAILGALGPIALKLIVDDLTGHDQRSVQPIVLFIALYVTSQWLARAAGEVRGLVFRRIQRRMVRTLSERLFGHLMHLPLRFHLDRQTGAVSETLANGLEGIQMVLNQLVVNVLPVMAELITVVVVVGRMAPPPFLALFCSALICYATAFILSASTISESARTASAARVEAGAAITDGLLNYELTKYFTAECTVQERVSRALARSETEWLTFSRRYARNGFIFASIYALFLAATTWYATIEVLHGSMRVGDFVLVTTYTLQLVRPVETMGNGMQGLSQGLAMLAKLVTLFHEVPESVPKVSSNSLQGPGTLQFDQVSLSYQRERPVLRNVSFRIAHKQTLGIVGPSGSGKSTIVRLLMRLLEPDRGQILLDGIPISGLSLPQVRNAIAVVPQDTALFNETIAYNIAFGHPGANMADIHQAARIAHLHELIMTFPDGYDTQVGERGLKLSAGERQRVSIARAVIKSPRIFIFDEATSSLDSQTEQDIVASLRDIAAHTSTLVIAHRLSTVLHADEIAVLEDGRITETGSHSSLLRQNGRYAALWRTQQRGIAAA